MVQMMRSTLAALPLLICVWQCVTLCTSASLSFIAVGDWGTADEMQSTVAARMARVAEETNVSLIVSTGDNFYDDGVESSADSQFHDTFTNVYSAKSLQLPWIIAAGNHDHYGNAQVGSPRSL